MIVHEIKITHKWYMCSPLLPLDPGEDLPPPPPPPTPLFYMNCI